MLHQERQAWTFLVMVRLSFAQHRGDHDDVTIAWKLSEEGNWRMSQLNCHPKTHQTAVFW